jgi:hypothetical protein
MSFRRDAVHGLTRAVAGLLAIVVVYAAVVLYLFPDRAGQLFAWNIQPPINAAFMGAAYANGVVFLLAAITGRHWHRIAAPHAGVFAFATLLLIATVLHWDRFTHGHPVFWAWIFVYAVAPALVPLAFVRNRGEDPGTPDSIDAVVPRFVRVAWALAAAAFLVVCLIAFLQPARVIAIWPWKLTPLTARVMASFYALLGVAPLTVVGEPRWSAWRLGLSGIILWHALLLVAALRRSADFFTPPSSTPWFWLECAFLIVVLIMYVAMESRRRAAA